MSETPTHAELNAKLETVEARAATREATLGGKIDRLVDVVESMKEKIDIDRQDRQEDRRKILSDNSFTRWTIAGIMLTATIGAVGIVVSTQGTAATQNGNILAAIEAAIAAKPGAPTAAGR